jgi:hypothetical protein
MNDTPAQHKFGQHLPDIQIAFVLALDKVKTTQRKIASFVKCSRKAVRNALANYTFETFKEHKARRKYQRITTEHEDQDINDALEQNPFLPLRDITNILFIQISEKTLRCRRSELGLGSYIAAKEPGLRPENVEARLHWALEHVNWSLDEWKHVIWFDESSIWVGVNPRRQWVVRPPGERLNQKYVKKTFKSAQVKVMVWACFTDERLGPMIICDEGGISANKYEDILFDGLFSLIDDILAIPDNVNEVQIADENTFLFMQDNAKCHKANEVLEFLKENNIPVMDWPAQSPDLNPLENLWSEFKKCFHQRFSELFNYPTKSLEAQYRYGEIMQEVWYSQGMEMVEVLIESMPRCCQAVIDANGGWTKY